MDPRYLTVMGACLTQFTIIGLLFSYGLFFDVFQSEFGWSRTLLSSCSALAFLAMGGLAILSGRLNDRFGPRPVLAFTGVCYGVGFVLLSQVTAAWQLFLIFGTLIAIGMGSHDVVTLSTIARWFGPRRGIMTGVVKVGTAIGQILVPPIAAFLIIGVGWRAALVTLGVSAICLLFVAAMAMSRPPVPDLSSGSDLLRGSTYEQARKTRQFWTLCAIQFLFFPALMTIPLHLPVHGMDLDMTRAQAATLLSVIGASSIAGRLIVGVVADRFGGKRAFVICFSTLILGLLGLMLTDVHWILFGVVAVYGFGHGGFFTVVSPTVAEYFGMRAHGAVFGTVLFFGTIGGSVGPLLAGVSFDWLGSYQPAFLTLFGFAVLGLLLVLSLPSAEPKADVVVALDH